MNPNPPDTDKAPSPWSVINDFSKTIITLSSALFALAVTFSGTLLGKSADEFEVWLLFGSWCGLVVSIAFGVMAHGFLVNYLRSGSHARWTIISANVSFFALTAAAIAFLFFGKLTLERTAQGNFDAIASVQKVLNAMALLSGTREPDWRVNSLIWNQTTKMYDLVLVDRRSSQKYSISLDAGTGGIRKLESGGTQTSTVQVVLDVPEIQRRLTNLGYRPGPVDGIMGNRTKAALKQLQLDAGLPATGVLDKETLARLALAKPSS